MSHEIIEHIPKQSLHIYGIKESEKGQIALITRADGAMEVYALKKYMDKRFLRYLMKANLELCPSEVQARIANEKYVVELSSENKILYRQSILPMQHQNIQMHVTRVLSFLRRDR